MFHEENTRKNLRKTPEKFEEKNTRNFWKITTSQVISVNLTGISYLRTREDGDFAITSPKTYLSESTKDKTVKMDVLC